MILGLQEPYCDLWCQLVEENGKEPLPLTGVCHRCKHCTMVQGETDAVGGTILCDLGLLQPIVSASPILTTKT